MQRSLCGGEPLFGILTDGSHSCFLAECQSAMVWKGRTNPAPALWPFAFEAGIKLCANISGAIAMLECLCYVLAAISVNIRLPPSPPALRLLSDVGRDRTSRPHHRRGSVPVHHTDQSLPLKTQSSESSGDNLRL